MCDRMLAGVRTVERDTLGVLSERELATLLKLLDKVLARAAEVAAEPALPLDGRRNRPQRNG